jgi:hypothetical protein
MKGIDQDQLSEYHGSSLEVDSLPAAVVESLYVEQSRLNVSCGLRHRPLKVGEEGWVVQGPF